MIGVTENLAKTQGFIDIATRNCGRPPGSVTLLAVSKRQPPAAIREAALAGQRDFGENYVDEALEKIATVSDLAHLSWHFIGRVQSNKTREIATHFDWVHTVERGKIARRLHEQRPAHLPPLNVCLQVNIDNAPTKAGIAPTDVAELLVACEGFSHLQVRGLMCMPDASDNCESTAHPFARLRALQDDLNASGANLDTLSMGMSADMLPAITEGATIVRVGTAIFGPRTTLGEHTQ